MDKNLVLMTNDKCQMTNEGKIFRIIDANLNRATEGARVVEEICRFILEDEKLTLSFKKIRGLMRRVIRESGNQGAGYQGIGRSGTLLKKRESVADVGRKSYTKSEGRRESFEGVFVANMKRAQEAVRCLEEFSKLIKPVYGQRFKAIRFKLYQLEKELHPRIVKAVKLDFGIYVVTDQEFDHLKMIRRALAGCVKMIQLRDKYISREQYLRLAKKAARLISRKWAVFILNDYWDMVEKVGAAGVHLGQADLRTVSLAKVRKEIGDDKIIGVSTHSYAQALQAAKAGADYISVGPIYRTPSKPGIKPVGIKLLRRVLRSVRIPVVAIGGIDKKNIGSVRRAGCRRAAVIRAAGAIV